MKTIHDPNQESGWLIKLAERGAGTLSRAPAWVVPPVIGAVLLFIMTSMRGVILLFLQPSPRFVLEFLLAVVVASAAGAVAGFAFVAVRIPLRHLWLFGDLLTGIIIGCVYMFSILVPGTFLFGDESLSTRHDWFVAALFGGGFGVLGAVVVWYNRWRFRNKPWSQLL